MNNSEEAIKKVLQEPFINEFPDYVRKIRNSLIIISVISIFAYYTGVTVSTDSKFLGLDFENLEPVHLNIIFLILNFYFFIHFLWCSLQNFVEWRLRLTGTKEAYPNSPGFASEDIDRLGDFHQSTLYRWWHYKVDKIKNFEGFMNHIAGSLEKIETQFFETPSPTAEVHRDITKSLKKVSENLITLSSNVENLSKMQESKRIKVSLERFDNWFRIILKSQNLRWVFFELSMPLVLGVSSIALQLYGLTKF